MINEISEVWGEDDSFSFPVTDITCSLEFYAKLNFNTYNATKFDGFNIFYLEHESFYPATLEIREHLNGDVAANCGSGKIIANIIFDTSSRYEKFLNQVISYGIEIKDINDKIITEKFPNEVFAHDPDGYITSISLINDAIVSFYEKFSAK